MKSLKKCFVPFFAAIAVSTSAVGHSAVGQGFSSVRCDGCSSSAKQSAAMNWANKRISAQEAQAKVTKHFHILDSASRSVTTYEVWKSPKRVYHGDSPGSVYLPGARVVPTPSDISRSAAELFNEELRLTSHFSDAVIPSTVVESPWQFVDCGYCVDDVADYLNGSDKISATALRRKALLDYLHVDGPSEKYEVSLEDGGNIIMEVETGDQSFIVKSVRVIDTDNNTVPLTSSALDGLKVRVEQQSVHEINRYLAMLGFMLGDRYGRTGIAVVTQCHRPGETDDSGLPECGSV
jgi:hypothetical protein